VWRLEMFEGHTDSVMGNSDYCIRTVSPGNIVRRPEASVVLV